MNNKSCAFEGCQNHARSGPLCSGHYQQKRKGRELAPLRRKLKSTTRNELGQKSCYRCLRWLDVSEFHPAKRTSDGLNSGCATCDKLTKYNISRDQYDSMMSRQGGGCAICGGVNVDGTALAVDHDHGCCSGRKGSCGKCVRGLLCVDCNRVLGMMADDPKRLRKAADYLEGGDAQ